MNRVDFAALCDHKGIKRAVEIGTDRGTFAREFLERWHGELLVCVDPYTPYNEVPFDRAGDLALAAAVLAPFSDRVRIVRATSIEAASWFPYPPLGFVYIDGNHELKAVSEDIAAWWPLIVPGGILAGHDYGCDEHPGVTAAVDLFAATHGLALNLTSDFNAPRSWWMEKPQ